ncbi:EAL domain-containing protein [Mangrovitalea sediminis]|uniref:EAL domain-containing protein n=1 Tax=Mangrovitalea sediminis TaxID=1982043 RepID=UPI000BE4C12B|nr:EAL domain-containing protein [Mangrovitalea sediminis]
MLDNHFDENALFDESHCQLCVCGANLDFDFSFAFQPIVDVQSRSVYAYEALVRGTKGEGAMTVLEKVNSRNRYRFDQACRVRAVKLASELGLQEYLSINFMPMAVYRAESCIRTTLAAAKEFGFDTRKLIFEITEQENLSSTDHLKAIINAYSEMGFQTALDDFGAGFSRLNLLCYCQPELLKLDMELVRDIHKTRSKQALVKGICLSMNELNCTVIAEGVETVEEYEWLADQGIRYFQGYLFGKPAFERLETPIFPPA